MQTDTAALTATCDCLFDLRSSIVGLPAGTYTAEYIQYLSKQGFVPPGGEGWVDHIRKKGNEATHEIALMQKQDAEELITFSEMLLKFIYEFPAKMKKKIPSPPTTTS